MQYKATGTCFRYS